MLKLFCRAALLVVLLATNVLGAEVASTFRFADVSERSLGLWEGDRPVLVYNHGVMSKPGVPADRNRSSYIHPLYGLSGEILSDDFPKDHFHHRGLFWSWPHVRIGDETFDLWMLKGIEHRFERWITREPGASAMGGGAAILALENGWYVRGQRQVRETVSMRVQPSTADEQVIDFEFVWSSLHHPLTLQGAEGKSYGGLTLRFAPHVATVITTARGQGKDDLAIARLAWADLAGRFGGRTETGGASIFISPTHPDYPPEWLTRHYGVLCVGWPGVRGKTFSPGELIRCRYRVWIHRGAADVQRVQRAYEAYERLEGSAGGGR